jgi:hypothetical protein
MKQRKLIITQTLRMAAILLFLISSQLPLVACQKSRRPSRYLIPEGYVGWVKVYFNVKDAAPVELEDGRHLFKFPSTGKLETSSNNEYGVGPVDEFFYYSDKSRRQLQIARSDGSGMIWNVHNGQKLDSHNRVVETYEGFFVGTEQDYREYGCHKDENGQPSTGLIDKSILRKCSAN